MPELETPVVAPAALAQIPPDRIAILEGSGCWR